MKSFSPRRAIDKNKYKLYSLRSEWKKLKKIREMKATGNRP